MYTLVVCDYPLCEIKNEQKSTYTNAIIYDVVSIEIIFSLMAIVNNLTFNEV